MSMNLDLEKIIKSAIEDNIKLNIDKFIDNAKLEVEKNIRENIGKIVCGVFRHMDFMRNEGRLIITVKTDEGKL